MKRTEMLKVISNLLSKNSVHLPLSSDEVAEAILFAVENEGMLPPPLPSCGITNETHFEDHLACYNCWEEE